ncbi:lamin tail domain-containing protein [Halogeometricum sp. S1BR25-6]|uniref:Lamin tail domain-containing protein n=1 Tax=Halogeometricum salsisoli TaxID=2950536 RepID=A0ABU2GK45_9EURY|nr:lamin tail domain-containing protein [Halogeometricum sp. S1BR25-6]MDS0301186.1 lamin tail domain-containing protein [Halogeometricum sp. S1BR25-6]
MTVVRIVDGDTFEVRFSDGRTENVRLLGIDTPEVHVENDPEEFEEIPDTPHGEAWLRDWGHKASEFARTEVGGETLTIETDPSADRRGSYGRLLVYVYEDGTETASFNRELIDQGYARMYDSSFSKRPAFSDAETAAQTDDVGLWDYEATTSTSTPTPAPSSEEDSLAVVQVHADAEGNDHENENDEYVVFENTGDATLDLSGWTVSDEADHTYTFSGTTVDPGDPVTLYTGSGTDTNSEVYWGSDAAIWNNNGDTVIVTNADGETVIQYEY